MQNTTFRILILSVFTSLVIGCADNSSSSNTRGDGGGGNRGQGEVYVDWDSVPEEYNPETVETQFSIDGVEKIKINIFGFNNDFRVIYSDKLEVNSAQFKVFKVSNGSVSWGDVNPRYNFKELSMFATGSYSCSIRVKNRKIADLDGGCYTRMIITLPVGSEVEVYNVGQLVTRRFIPIDTATFLKSFKDEVWKEGKFKTIEDFVNSYKGTRMKPEITCDQLGFVVSEFLLKEEKYKALRMLQAHVTDRENLFAMIESKFSYFEREEARRIVGL